MGHVLLVDAAVVGASMFALWLVSLPLRDASIVDPFWGFGFVLVAWTAALVRPGGDGRWLLVALVTIWGLRLSLHLARRNLGHGEDFRYRAMRARFPVFPLTSLLIVFGLQGVLLWVVSLPVQLAHDDGPILLVILGTGVWAVGLAFESFGDAQLARFRADPANRGHVLETGLWRYTRHPNYFGDFCVWWGLYLVAAGVGAPWWTIVGPIVMSVLLRRVSGVTLLEQSLARSKPGYAAYAARTSAFFPRPPRR